ncbi:MAG TPA: TadE family protein [Candidatus Deferrimicrobium sp.]|nr:TadE family protein [Candidatus Deferrimicrobium sp.]
MISRSRRDHRQLSAARSRGQALVEFAMVAPIFLLMLFAVIDFGRYIYYVQVLNNAAREGARYAIVHGTNSFPSSGPPVSGKTSTDPTGADVVAIARNYAVGVIGNSTILQICPYWMHADSPAPPPETSPTCTPGDGTNAREQLIVVRITYQFRSVIPVVPIPPITITGESTLVINN